VIILRIICFLRVLDLQGMHVYIVGCLLVADACACAIFVLIRGAVEALR